jgi:type I restriction enzyme R subunit
MNASLMECVDQNSASFASVMFSGISSGLFISLTFLRAMSSLRLLDTENPEGKSREIEIKVISRLQRRRDNPTFVALGERLERLKERHEQGQLHSIQFLKELLTLARDVVEAEQRVDPADEQARAKAALTELFAETRNGETPAVEDRIVADIDGIVRGVRFPGWQGTKAGERDVQKALRRVVYVKYQIKDQDLFDRAFGYIQQYY